MRRIVLAWVALVALLVPGPPALASDNESTRASLKGLGGVWVLVESFSEAAQRAGFDDRNFQTDVELKLRMAGIKVQTEEEWLATPGRPWLYLLVSPQHERRGARAAFAIHLELKQFVTLVRNDAPVPAATWSTGSVGFGDLPYVRDGVKGGVDEFINAWLNVNPKE